MRKKPDLAPSRLCETSRYNVSSDIETGSWSRTRAEQTAWFNMLAEGLACNGAGLLFLITHGIFPLNNSKKTPHSSPVRTRNGLDVFCGFVARTNFKFPPLVLCSILRYILQRYIGVSIIRLEILYSVISIFFSRWRNYQWPTISLKFSLHFQHWYIPIVIKGIYPHVIIIGFFMSRWGINQTGIQSTGITIWLLGPTSVFYQLETTQEIPFTESVPFNYFCTT